MQGLDFAFYQGRSRYHTWLDAIPYLEGGKQPVWSMLEAAWGAGRALLDAPAVNERDPIVVDGKGNPDAVYFDRKFFFFFAGSTSIMI
jgi:hypothetical protein